MEQNQRQDLDYCKKPLSISITIRCIAFIIILCISLGVVIYYSYQNALYKRDEEHITEILKYVDSHIDDDDLSNCVDTLTESDKYKELVLFMDGIMNDFNIHYLYILKPVVTEDRGKQFMSIISAEDYHNRYEDTEGNLYLGWISSDEYPEEEVDRLQNIMKQKEIVFYTEETEWGLDYTGALPLYNSKGECYAVLAVDVNISDISRDIARSTLEIELTVVLLGIVFTIFFLCWARMSVTSPINKLERSVVNFVNRTHHDRGVDNMHYQAPDIHTENEVESLSRAMKEMSEDIKGYIQEIFETEKKANQMASLATRDTLTGIRNKTAYDDEVKKMEAGLESGELKEFGFAMIDLNYLKKINDTYGHEKGNISIKRLSALVCDVFKHSPVFRIGGDEFIAVLKGNDYAHREELVKEFRSRINALTDDDSLEPWDRISAAIGVSTYDESVERSVDSVFKAADEEMYKNKNAMKAARE